MNQELVGNGISYVAYLAALWCGAGFIIGTIEKIAHRLHLSPFIISFTLLGLLTSIPETAVGLTAVAEGRPIVFVGNLIGGVPILFLLFIPLLAIFSGRIIISHHIPRSHLLIALLLIALPSLLTIDSRLTFLEGLAMLVFYLVFMYSMNRQYGMLQKKSSKALTHNTYSFFDLMKILTGVAIVFFASQQVVSQTIYFAEVFAISPYYVSLFALSLGTNLPEFSVTLRAIINHKRDIALGDYLGSAAANTFLFGLFTVLSGTTSISTNHFFLTFLFIALGLGLFYYFSASKNDISRREGLILFTLYLLFVIVELL